MPRCVISDGPCDPVTESGKFEGITLDWVKQTVFYYDEEYLYEHKIKVYPTFNPNPGPSGTTSGAVGYEIKLLLCILNEYVWLQQPDPSKYK